MMNRLNSRLGTRITAVVSILAFLLILSSSALAQTTTPTPAPTPVSYAEYNESVSDVNLKIYIGLYCVTEPHSQQSDDLYKLKTVLFHNGYYGDVDSGSIDWYSQMLDSETLNAVREYCMYNQVPEYDNQWGLTYGAWWAISSGSIIDLNNPDGDAAGEVYADIPWGEGGEGLTAILDRLYELGYLDNRAHAVYDEDVRDALQAFGESNGLQDYFAQDEHRAIGADLQRVLFSKDAKAKPAPKKASASDYFMRPVSIAGLQLPMLAVWCIGLAVLVACVLAAIYFFMPSDAKKTDKRKKNTVRFDISYNGKTLRTESQITKTLKIGRGVGNFPLDPSDTEISRRHCELYYLNTTLMLRDYSSFGTLVNGKMVHNAEEILKNGDVLTIGRHNITIAF